MEEQKEKDSVKVHQGRNVRIARASKNMTQEGLGDLLKLKQKEISRLESLETIDDAILENIALALNVSVGFLKEFDLEEHAQTYYNNSTNTINEHGQNYQGHADTINNFPLSEVMEMTTKLLDMQKEHYEKEMVLLKESCLKDTEIALLKQRLEMQEGKK